jgi:hypothetical protein
MQAVLTMAHGGRENLKFVADHPKPTLGAGQVLVRIAATAIFMRPVAENFVTGADGLIFGAATSPAGLACAAILPNSSIGPAWALTAPKKSIDPAAKPATILRDNIQFIIIPPPPT